MVGGWVLGIDHGADGAAVILRGSTAVAAMRWKPCVRNGVKRLDLRISRGDQFDRRVVSRFSDLGFELVALLCELGADEISLAIEDVYLGKNVATTMTLAKRAGAIIAPIERKFDVDAVWVSAGEWRAITLGLPRNTKRAVVKRVSAKLIPARVLQIGLV